MFFNDEFADIIEQAKAEAKEANYNFAGGEHILLALAKHQDGVAGAVLQNLGIELDAAQIKQEIERLLRK